MEEIKTLLCDGREDVRNALAAIDVGFPFTLRAGYSRAGREGELIVYAEWSNVSTDCPVVDALSYQVTVWAGDLDRLRLLCAGVNAALTGLGLKRTFAAPDGFDGQMYKKTFRFGRRVDKRTMRLID